MKFVTCTNDLSIDLLGNVGINPLPHMPILGSSNSAANKDMMEKIWAIFSGETIIRLNRKHCGKRRNCLLQANFSFSNNVFKSSLLLRVKKSIYGVKG